MVLKNFKNNLQNTWQDLQELQYSILIHPVYIQGMNFTLTISCQMPLDLLPTTVIHLRYHIECTVEIQYFFTIYPKTKNI